MAFSVLLVCMSSSLAVFREVILKVWEQMPDSTLWREKKNGVEGVKNGEGREMRDRGRRRGRGRETNKGWEAQHKKN